MLRKALLVCGIAASVLYVAANIIVPLSDANYSVISQTISELSAIGAPTRPLWMAILSPYYSVLMAAFGVGVWLSAGRRFALRAIGVCVVVNAVVGAFWPPMHVRGAEFTTTDTMHIVWTALVVGLFLLQTVFGAFVFGKGFRVYSIATFVVMLVFGILTSMQAPNVPVNLPTPTIGIWERVNAGAYTLWLVVLAVRAWRNRELRIDS